MSTMKIHRKYDDEFRRDAVRLLMTSGRTVKDVAKELGIERSCLGRWRIKHLKKLDEEATATGMTSTDLENENKRLRKELAYAQEQRDILKKACGILSDRPERSMS